MNFSYQEQTSAKFQDTFGKLKGRWSEVESLRAAVTIMQWDQSTYLPDAAAEVRGRNLSALSKMSHELSTRSDVGEWLEDLWQEAKAFPPDSDVARLIAVAREDYQREARVPSDFHARLSALYSELYVTWKRARSENNFQLIAPLLEKNVELSRELSGYLRKPGHSSLIDPLIDVQDPGFTEAMIRPVFSELRPHLVRLIEEISGRARETGPSCLHGQFDEAKQIAFGESVIKQLGFDFKRGRQDKTAHPFMTRFSGDDVRITTRVLVNDVSEALFSTIHEAGHAMYELGVDLKYDGTPLGHGSSSGIHESQSRLWENIVARSRPFWEYYFPKLQATFPDQLAKVSVGQFHRAVNRVERSLIRTEADEVTYNLHVMIRFDLECDLLAGRLKVRDLPEAWNARYKSDLGLTPPTDANGVMQDVHWFSGPVGGEFQGYTIGNILSAQLFAAALKAHPDLFNEFRRGEFKTLREWLRVNLHQFGRKLEGPDLIRRATGSELRMTDYIHYLETKYTKT